MRKIFVALVVAFAFVYGAGSVDSVEKSAILPSKGEYKIVRIVVGTKTMEAREGAIFGVDGARIYGNTGCNNYFTDFKRVDSQTIEISTNGGSTKMMCDREANEFERVFLENLVGKFSVADSNSFGLSGEYAVGTIFLEKIVLGGANFYIVLQK